MLTERFYPEVALYSDESYKRVISNVVVRWYRWSVPLGVVAVWFGIAFGARPIEVVTGIPEYWVRWIFIVSYPVFLTFGIPLLLRRRIRRNLRWDLNTKGTRICLECGYLIGVPDAQLCSECGARLEFGSRKGVKKDDAGCVPGSTGEGM